MSSLKTLTIADIATRAVEVIPEFMPIKMAIALFAEKCLSCLIVAKGAKPIGIITERDLLRMACSGYDENRAVRAIMSAPLLTAQSDMSFSAAQNLLSNKRVRHLVLVDADGGLYGIVSETDFRRHISEDMFGSIQHLGAVMDMSGILVSPDQPLSDVLEHMSSRHLDHVIIGRDGIAAGIITERDVPKLLVAHVDTTAVPCSSAMSCPVKTIGIDHNVPEAAAQMTTTGLRHLVVVDEQGKYCGIVSQHRLLERLSVVMLEASHDELMQRANLSEQRFQYFVENLQFPLCHVNGQKELIFVNRRFVELFGYTQGDVPTLAEWWQRAYPDPAYRQWVLKTWTEVVAESRRTGNPIRSFEYRVTCKDGSVRYIEISGITMDTSFLATFNDVTTQHLAREKADELMALLQKISAKIPGVIYQYQQWPDGSTAFPYASPGIETIYGVSADEVRTDATPVFKALHPDDLEQVAGTIKASMEALTTWRDTYRAVLPDGRIIWLEGEAEPEAMPDGSVLWHGYIHDITNSKTIAARLREFSLAIEQSPESVIITNLEADIEYVNEAFVRNTGYSYGEVIGQNPRLLHSGKTSPENYVALWRALTSGEPWTGEFHNRRKDGSEYIERAIITPLRQADGRITHYVAVKEDITERKQTEEELRKSEEQYRVIATYSPAGIFKTDAQGDYVFANPRWCEIAGMSSDEALGQGWIQALYPDDKQRIFDGWYAATSAGLSWDWECRFVTKQGKVTWITGHAEALFDAHGNAQGYLGIIVDVTERKQVEDATRQQREHLEELVEKRTRELAIAKDAAETANIAKSTFLANMSHEIRTPLNAITGMAHILRRSGLTSEQTDKLDKIENAGSHLLRIISDVLDLSKIEAGKFVLEDTSVHVEALLGNITSMLDQKARDKGLRFNIETSALPYHLYGDSTRLQQALLNYVANAIKFTETGHITLRVREEAETNETATLRFEVEDTGIGIAPEVLTKLFSVFEQADKSTTRKYGGTGLGLAITKKIAEVMGGTAGATSSAGQGSTFWFTAKLRKTSKTAAQAARARIEAAEQIIQREHAGKRILLAEDEPINREIAQMLLEDVGLQIDQAEDGRKAVEKARLGSYAIILMDMQMPVQDGLDATRDIRQLPGHRTTPILAMTANAFAEDKDRCFAAGMDDFLSKPVKPEILYARLLKWLEQNRV